MRLDVTSPLTWNFSMSLFIFYYINIKKILFPSIFINNVSYLGFVWMFLGIGRTDAES